MPTYTQIYYHIVFSTKNRMPTLQGPNRQKLFNYLWSLLQNKKCHPYQIGGVDDHIHIYTHLHPTVTLAGVVKDVKLASSEMIRREHTFPKFTFWQEGYGGFTHSFTEKDRMVRYVANQEEHHKTENFREEFMRLLKEKGVDFDEKYLD